MDLLVKTIEDMSLNAWPSHQMQFYDGWVLRFSFFYTHRTNCVEQIGASRLPLHEKVEWCEEMYRRWRTPCIFKITPLTDPVLVSILEERGYHIEAPATVMTMDLRSAAPQSSPAAKDCELVIKERVDSEWLSALFVLKGTNDPDHLRVVPAMYDAVPKDETSVLAKYEGVACGTGLAIYDRDYAGIYAINVAPSLRRRGIASQMLDTLIDSAVNKGARGAYLQVRCGNDAAMSLYRRIGFSPLYDYHFMVREV